MRRVLIPGSAEEWQDHDAVELLEGRNCEVVFREPGYPVSDGTLIEFASGVNAVLGTGFPFTRRVFEELPALRAIARTGVGYDSIDVDAATDHGVMVTITPGVNSESVATWAMALLLSVVRRIPAFDRDMHAGLWDRPMVPEVSGKTLGVVGLGSIGKCLVRRSEGFGMTVLAYDPDRDEAFAAAHEIAFVELDDLLRQSDFVSVHCPLTDRTRGLLAKREFRLMKPTAYLINTARGSVIDEPSLVDALREGEIAGAGLDVFAQEPFGESPLREMDNVVLAPHMGSGTDEAYHSLCMAAARNIADCLDGKRPVGLVNPACEPRSEEIV